MGMYLLLGLLYVVLVVHMALRGPEEVAFAVAPRKPAAPSSPADASTGTPSGPPTVISSQISDAESAVSFDGQPTETDDYLD
jgi:hypothetical protein